MNVIVKRILQIGGALFTLLQMNQANAECYFLNGQSEQHVIHPITVQNFSAFRYANDASAFFTASLIAPQSGLATCSNAHYIVALVESNSPGPMEQITPSHAAFSTNYTGLAISIGGPALAPVPRNALNSGYTAIRIYFHRLENMAPGVIQGEALPIISLYLTEDPTGQVTTGALKISTLSFSGSFNVTTPTCQFTNKTVNLGTHSPEYFTAPGTTTDWVDSSVRYQCDQPTYFANYTQNYNQYGVSTTASGYNIVLTYVVPTTESIDVAKGIFAVEQTSGSATGVAIQYSRQRSEDRFTSLTSAYNNQTVPTGQDYYDIPIFVRYIQTESAVTPGHANGKLILTTSYR